MADQYVRAWREPTQVTEQPVLLARRIARAELTDAGEPGAYLRPIEERDAGALGYFDVRGRERSAHVVVEVVERQARRPESVHLGEQFADDLVVLSTLLRQLD